MPYRDEKDKESHNRNYYLANKEKLNKKRTETRKKVSDPSKSLSQTPKVVSTPVTNPNKQLLDSLREKMAEIKPVLKPTVPQVFDRPAYAPKIKVQNFSESTKYEYADF